MSELPGITEQVTARPPRNAAVELSQRDREVLNVVHGLAGHVVGVWLECRECGRHSDVENSADSSRRCCPHMRTQHARLRWLFTQADATLGEVTTR